MKKGIIAVSALVVVAALVTACQAPKPTAPAPPPPPTTNIQKASYGIGVNVGESLIAQKVAAVPDLVVRGFKDAYSGTKTLLTPQEAQDTVKEFMAQQPKGNEKPGDKNNAPPPAAGSPLQTLNDRISYVAGMSIGTRLKMQSVTVDADQLSQGISDKLGGKKLALSDADIKTALDAFTKEYQDKQAKAMQEQMKTMQAAAEKNKKAGTEFLAKNKMKKDVKVLPSGLQYKIVKAGTGKKPTSADTVVCNYRGTLIDGTEFDSSYKRGTPASFPVTGVIAGWTEALKLMPVGSKWQLFIPGNLAYGPSGRPPVIGPNSTLIFDIELLSIKK